MAFIKKRARSKSVGVPYLIFGGTLDDCIGEFMLKDRQHLYEIYTKPQPPSVTEVLEREHITELARLRDFLSR
jgi:hypothetical protein